MISTAKKLSLPYIAFVMDPLSNVSPAADTSFAFMLAAQATGYQVLHLCQHQISLDDGEVLLHGTVVTLADQPHEFILSQERATISANQCQAIFIRTDPPFDEAYLNTTWLLSIAEEQGVRIVNSPRGLRNANEHLYSLYYPELCPQTLISSQIPEIRQFVKRHNGEAIGKPIDGHAGFGVVKLRLADSNFNALCDLLTAEGKTPIMVQEYVPDAVHGDKRLIVVDGELRGAIRRVPGADDHRGNVHVGATVAVAEIDDDDRRVVAAMARRLAADGLFFVGLDMIGGKLIEVNVTSPTLLREIHALGGSDIAHEVLQKLSA